MQAKDIKIGNEYAVQYSGKIVFLRAVETIAVNDGRVTTNHVAGYLDGETGYSKVRFPVKSILDDAESYKLAEAEKIRRRAAEEARLATETKKREYASCLLAKAIGAAVILESRASPNREKLDGPCISAVRRDITINQHAIDALTNFLQDQGVKLDEEM
jgi:hypothetical protein